MRTTVPKKLLAFSKANDFRLNVQLKQFIKYKDYLNLISKNHKSLKPKDINFNFINDLKKDFESAQNNIELKSEKIEKEISKNKETIEKIDENIEKYQSSKNESFKQKLLEELENDILKLEKMIEILKEQNQQLRKELELIIEKNQKNIEKNSLEKENINLKEKIESLKNKTQDSKNDFVDKTENIKNSITKSINDDIKFFRNLTMKDIQDKSIDDFKQLKNIDLFKKTNLNLSQIVNYAQDFDDYLIQKVKEQDKQDINKITYKNTNDFEREI